MTTETVKRKRGRPPKSEGALTPVERQRRYIERLKAAAAEGARAQTDAPASLDVEALREILKEGRRRLSVGHQQVEWLHEGLANDTPHEITGPAWQLRFCMVDWKELIEQVESWAAITSSKPGKRS